MKTTIVIPSYNERDNVEPLLRRIDEAMGSRDFSVLYVDDSKDDTPAVVERCARTSRFPVACMHRDAPIGGLSGAVVAGIEAAKSDVVVVCDGDGQHPPQVIPEMLDVLERDARTDIVVASRYRAGGDAGGLANGMRRSVSKASTYVAKALFPRRLRDCTDPMTGFFALRTKSIQVARLNPIGFKILLEILATHDLNVAEVPFAFGERAHGESKATMKQGMAYMKQLVDLRRGRRPRSFAS